MSLCGGSLCQNSGVCFNGKSVVYQAGQIEKVLTLRLIKIFVLILGYLFHHTAVDPCDSSPCLNSGVCFNSQADNSYRCFCLTGWEGTNCEIDTDFCASSPCANGAACIDQMQGFECQCQPGWSGTTCEIG